MNIFKLKHNNFGEILLLAKFIEKPCLEQIKQALLENLDNIEKIDFHSTNLLSRNSSSISVGEWLELNKD